MNSTTFGASAASFASSNRLGALPKEPLFSRATPG
jgi:hypothetical protein